MPAANDDTGRAVPPPPPPTFPQWQTAIHEAGHACAALLLGVPDIGAVIFDTGGGLCSMTPEAETAAPDMADYAPERLRLCYLGEALPALMRNAVWTAAGNVAADLATRHSGYRTEVSGGDASMLRAMCRQAFPGCDDGTEQAFAGLAVARARALLVPNMPRVLAVAQRLWQTTRLSGDDVCRAMFPECMRKEPR